ncbi:MAG: hypothetical protein JWO55_806 [Candidatus Saccharibacteria bacterium]|jgi:hypothetical protein|nr:hypothetical protein [Candidatus Saccharibacteria bacterium]
MSGTSLITPGVYRHYKGGEYKVIGIGRNTETEEDVVIYQPLYKSDVAYWVRPYEMFFDTVEADGVKVSRFKKVRDDR